MANVLLKLSGYIQYVDQLDEELEKMSHTRPFSGRLC